MARERPDIATAQMQFRVRPERIAWIHAATSSNQDVQLYNGQFPEPFGSLEYHALRRANQLTLVAVLGANDEFNSRYGSTVGTLEDLKPMLKKYADSQIAPDGSGMALLDRNGLPAGVIARNTDGRILIRKDTAISSEEPVNDLSIALDQFNLLVQRYVSSIWKASPETDKKEFGLVLDIPSTQAEGMVTTYLSTAEVILPEFAAKPRPVRLNEIGGYPRVKQVIASLLMDLSQPDTSRKFGTQPFSNKFIFFTGDEGTGKSLLPKHMDFRMREMYGDSMQHYRISFTDLIRKYGPQSVTVLLTVLDHIRENEKQGIPTLLHLDTLHSLIPPSQRHVKTPDGIRPAFMITDAESFTAMQTLNPIIDTLSRFGKELGARSRHVIVMGESRAPREEHPEGVSRTFRKALHLKPTLEDLEDILRVQIATARFFARKTSIDPFAPEVNDMLRFIVAEANGLVGRDIQQAILNAGIKHKAQYDGENYPPVTAEQLKAEIESIFIEKGLNQQIRRPLGFLGGAGLRR